MDDQDVHKGLGRTHTYLAFISYSHTDQALARRLQRHIETFRYAKGVGDKPELLGRCFRDEDELAGGNLTPQIKRALATSGALIVICTPRSAASRWVALEIDTYRQAQPNGKIIALWFDETARDDQALPQGLEDLDLFVPEAKDFGEIGLFTRAVAALLETPLDALVQRQEQLLRAEQRRARRTLVLGATLLVAAIVGLGASAALGWRNALARSEILVSNARLNWDAHNPRLAGLLAIVGSRGENGFGPEANGVYPLLVDVLASPSLPIGVYTPQDQPPSAIAYTSDGRLVAVHGERQEVVAEGISYNEPRSPFSTFSGPARTCTPPAPSPSPLSGDLMEWSMTPGCHFAFATDGFGADFNAGPYNSASIGGRFRGEVSYVEFSEIGGLAVTRGDGGIAYVVSLNASEISVSAARTQISAVAFATDDRFLALGQEDGAVRLWVQDENSFSPDELSLIYGAPIAAGPVTAITFAPGNGEFAVLYAEGVVARFQNATFANTANRISLSNRREAFPYFSATMLFSPDSRSAWTSDGSSAVYWIAGGTPRTDENEIATLDATGAIVGHVRQFGEDPGDVAFLGAEIVTLADGAILSLKDGRRTRLQENLRDGRLIGSCGDDHLLIATESAVAKIRATDASIVQSWQVNGEESLSGACTDGDKLIVRTARSVALVARNGRQTSLRAIVDDEEEARFPVVTYAEHHFLVRGENNVLLLGDIRTRSVERLVVAADASILGYGVLAGGEFAIVGAQYGLESAPCIEWRVLHLPTRQWLQSVEHGRPEDVRCVRLAIADFNGANVHWLDGLGAGYTTHLPIRRDAWRAFCQRAQSWSLTDAEQAAYASLVPRERRTPCAMGRRQPQPTSARTHSPEAERQSAASSQQPTSLNNPTPLLSPPTSTRNVGDTSGVASDREPAIAAPSRTETQPSSVPAPITLSSVRFIWPVNEPIIRPVENDADRLTLYFDNPVGAPVKAAAPGDVVYAGDAITGLSNLVLIRHADGLVTAYGYLGSIAVIEGQTVESGDLIGVSDERGQLLFQIRDGQEQVDPIPLLPSR